MPVKIRTTPTYAKISENELSTFERENHITLPTDFRDFLLDTNGGQPTVSSLKMPAGHHIVINTFCGLHDGLPEEQLRMEDAPSNREKSRYLSIAQDQFNNSILLSLNENDYGHVFYYDRYTQQMGGALEEHLTFLADSFEGFTKELFESIDQRIDRLIIEEDESGLEQLLTEISPYRQNFSGRMVIEEAAFWGKDKLVEFLYEKGCPIGRLFEIGVGSLSGETIEKLQQAEIRKATGIEKVIEKPLVTLANPLTETHQPFPNAAFALEVSDDFIPIVGAPSLGARSRRARIDYVLLAGNLERQLDDFTEGEWARKDHALVSVTPLKLHGRSGWMYHALSANTDFQMMLMLLENGSHTIQLSGTFPKNQPELEDLVEQILLSWTPIEFNPLDQYDFTIHISQTPLHVAQHDQAHLLLTLDGYSPTEHPEQVTLSMTWGPEALLPADRVAYAENILSQSSGWDQSHIQAIGKVDTLTIDGLGAVTLKVQDNGLNFWMTIIFAPGYVYRFLGTALSSANDHFSLFDQILRSFHRKESAVSRDVQYETLMKKLVSEVEKLVWIQTNLSFFPQSSGITSNLWGEVAFPQNASLPKQVQTGETLTLLCQLLATDIPDLPVSRLQIFVDPMHFKDVDGNQSGEIVISAGLNETMDQWKLIPNHFSDTARMLIHPLDGQIKGEKSNCIPDWPEIVTQYPDILSLCAEIYPQTPALAYRMTALTLNALPARHFIGGRVSSGVKIPKDKDGKPMIFAGQIASEPEYGVMWKHFGSLLLFHGAEDLTDWRAVVWLNS